MAASTRIIRILIIDDHAVVREGLRLLVERQPGLQIVGEAANRREAFLWLAQQQSDIILLDLDLGSENGLDFLSDLLGAGHRPDRRS